MNDEDRPVFAPCLVSLGVCKKSEQSVSTGSVLMEGQVLDIRIITDKRMPQRVWRYKYEVLECDSPYIGCVDVIFSEFLMRAGHCYRVVVGENQRSPEIVTVIEEIEVVTGDGSRS